MKNGRPFNFSTSFGPGEQQSVKGTENESRLVQIFTRGNAPANSFALERSSFQHLHQNQASESVGFFGINGVLKGDFADRCDQITQGGMDPAVSGISFHFDSFNSQDNKDPRFSSKDRPSLVPIAGCMFKLTGRGLPSKMIHFRKTLVPA
jgi:hypothetical protein